MLKLLTLSNVLAFLSLVNAGITNPRSIVRSNENGIVNLVEFTVGRINRGLCSYKTRNEEQITVIYEEEGVDLRARSSLAYIDPVVATRQCRSIALDNSLQGRSNFNEENSDTETDLDSLRRFEDFQRKAALNQQYISQMSPRLINFVPLGTKPTKNGIFDKFLFLFNGASLSMVNIPIPALNIPKPFG